jgi:exonuclease SbcC
VTKGVTGAGDTSKGRLFNRGCFSYAKGSFPGEAKSDYKARRHPQRIFFSHPKRMIKRIELINFMSHEHTVIEPSSGLTVLIGPNNCGKSAIVTALQIISSNANSTYVLRHGAKECQIIVETDAGDVIQWSRKKSGSPKYVINGELFDRLKGKVPDQLHTLLRMPKVQVDKESFDVHFGEQTSPLFLLGDKEKAAAQFFASSSDAIRLVEMQDRHKSNIKIRKADLKRVTQQRDALVAENAHLAPVPELHKQAVKCEKDAAQIADEKKRITLIEASIEEMLAAELRSDMLIQQGQLLKVIPAPPQMQPAAALLTNLQAIATAEQQLAAADAELKELLKLQPPPQLTDTAPLTSLVQQFQHNQQTVAISAARLKALVKLQTPPEILPTGELTNMILRLQTQQHRWQNFDQQAKATADLPETPTIESTNPLADKLKEFDELLTKQAQQQGLLDSINASITDTENEIEDWLDDNPQCPTCGGEISKDQILEKSGGHVHA